MSTKKQFDLILYGASSTAGRMAARYLLNCKDAHRTKWAAAGRNEAKIAEVLRELGAKNVPIIVADSHDEWAVTDMMKKTRCIISTVGPYARYGTTLVEVASREGVHYADITGETHWYHDMQNQFDGVAKESKSIILHCAGFDSVPSDLGALLAVKKLKEATKSPCGLVQASVAAGGGVGGGTLLSAVGIMEAGAKDKKIRDLMADPYSFSPVKGKQKQTFPLTFRAGGDVGSYYIMEIINGHVVRKTWGMLEKQAQEKPGSFSYGEDFQYREFLKMPNAFVAGLVSATIYFFTGVFARFSLARHYFKKFAEKRVGSGPSEEVMRKGFMKWRTTATSIDGKTAAQCTLTGRGDPGYTLTGVMLVECALAMIHDYDELPELAKAGGHLTPATAFGEHILRDRLVESGRFEIKAEVVKP